MGSGEHITAPPVSRELATSRGHRAYQLEVLGTAPAPVVWRHNSSTTGACAGLGAEEALLHLEASPSCPLRYLGPYKVTTVLGLKVAVFDDLRAPQSKALIAEVDSKDGDIDLLLSCAWPAKVTAGVPVVPGAFPSP